MNRSICCRSTLASPTIEAAVFQVFGESAHGGQSAFSRLRELRSTLLPSPVHGGRRWLVQARGYPADLHRGGHGHPRRGLGETARRPPADDPVQCLRRRSLDLHDLRRPAGTLPHVRLPRRRPRRVAGPPALRPPPSPPTPPPAYPPRHTR